MSKTEIFHPQHDKDNPNILAPDTLIVMPSILGGNLRDEAEPDERVSDLGQRAQVLANYFGAPVLGIQRVSATDVSSRKHFLGLPRAYDPSKYMIGVAEEVRQIHEQRKKLRLGQISLVGVSAGAERGLAYEMAGAGFSSLFLFDPTAMRALSAPHAFGKWAGHQAKVLLQDKTGHPDTPNGNRLPYAAQGEVSAIEDMLLHRLIWTGASSLAALTTLAGNKTSPRTLLIIPERSFNVGGGQKGILALVRQLNIIAAQAGSNFRANTTALPHRATDDPVRLALMVERSKILAA